MTRSATVELLGVQEPRVSNCPPMVSTSGAEAIELAVSAGVFLFPWQQEVINVMLGERADGNWSAYELGLLVARQNGKGEILLVRELAGLFLLGERLLLHSAHEFKTAKEAYLRIKGVIEGAPHLASRVKQFYQSNQETAVELKNGARLRFMARSRQSGRGFSAQTLLMDEAQEMSEDALAALVFTTAAQANPQLIYTGTVPTAETANCDVFTSVRDRGRAGGDPQLAWMEWSVDPEAVDLDALGQRAQSNPTLGYKIPAETLERERLAVTDRTFAEERMSYWPDPVGSAGGWLVITEEQYEACATDEDIIPTALSIELTQDRETITVVAAGQTPEGAGAQVLLRAPNNADTLSAIAGLANGTARPITAVVVDSGSQAGSLVPDLEALGVTVVECSTKELVKATGSTLDAIRTGSLALRPSPELDRAVAMAKLRKRGDVELIDRWADGDSTPFIGVALAGWGMGQTEPSVALAAVFT